MYRRLKSGEIEKIFLSSKYVLKIENNNTYISRNGKKRYFLSSDFIHEYFIEDMEEDQEVDNNTLQDIKSHLEELLSNKKLGCKTKETLYLIEDLVDRLL